MSETDGGIGFRGFFSGFLCGAYLAAAFAITPTTSVLTRWTIYSGTIAACGHAFGV
jgi:hypothetical protein